MDLDDRLARDYQETANYFRCLADSRLKLLALVPVVAGASIAVFSKDAPASVLLPLSLLGFFVTLGILFVDQRNTEIYDSLLRRLKALEAAMAFPAFGTSRDFGGPFLDRPDRNSRLFGGIVMWHDRGLGLIYSTALGAWAYLFFATALSGYLQKRAIVVSIALGICTTVAFMLGVRSFRVPSIESQDQAIIDGARWRIDSLRKGEHPTARSNGMARDASTPETKTPSGTPFDPAALAGAAVAGTVAVSLSPGQYNVMSLVIGATLLAVIYAYEHGRSRDLPQSFALGMVTAFVALLPLSYVYESICSATNLTGVCHAPRNQADSRVPLGALFFAWIIISAVVVSYDWIRQARRRSQTGTTA